MAIGLYIWTLKNRLLYVFLSLLFFGCNNSENTENIVLHQDELFTGNLICRLGNGYFSQYFKEYASTEKVFSHIGILSLENDKLFVYHSEASELTGVGYVKKESLTKFLNGIKTYEYYKLNFSDSISNQIIKTVKSYYNKKTPFDMDFDSESDDKLYCTELIASSINKTLNDSIIKPTLNLNGKKLYALDDIYLNEYVTKITFGDNSYK